MVAPVPPMAEPTRPPATAPPTVPTVWRSMLAQPPRPRRETARTAAEMNLVFMGYLPIRIIRSRWRRGQPVQMTLLRQLMPDCRSCQTRLVVWVQKGLQGNAGSAVLFEIRRVCSFAAHRGWCAAKLHTLRRLTDVDVIPGLTRDPCIVRTRGLRVGPAMTFS